MCHLGNVDQEGLLGEVDAQVDGHVTSLEGRGRVAGCGLQEHLGPFLRGSKQGQYGWR